MGRGFRQGLGRPVDAEHRREPQLVHGLEALANLSHQRHQGDTGGLGPAGHTGHHLAPDALGVQPALAAEHQVCPFQQPVEAHSVQHGLDTGLQLRPEKGGHAVAHTPCRARAGHRGQVHAQSLLHHLLQRPQVLVQALCHGGVRPLLGAEDVSRPGLAVQGVVDVAHGDDLHPGKSPAQSRQVHPGDLPQGAAGGDECLAVLPKEPGPGRRGGAAAAVVGAAAPQAQDDLLAAGPGRVHHELPHPVGGGPLRVQPAFGQGQAGAGRHLDDCGAAALHQAVKACHLLPEGPLDRQLLPLPAHGGEEGLHTALAAVGHGHRFYLTAREHPPGGFRDLLAHLPGGQGALKGVRRQNDLFHSPLLEKSDITASAWSSCPCGTG